jgi:hypothetical protein
MTFLEGFIIGIVLTIFVVGGMHFFMNSYFPHRASE